MCQLLGALANTATVLVTQAHGLIPLHNMSWNLMIDCMFSLMPLPAAIQHGCAYVLGLMAGSQHEVLVED